MIVEWNNGNKYVALYWHDNLNLENFEHFIKYYDVIEVIYPLSYDKEIYNKYGDLLYYIENEGYWNADVSTGCIDLKTSQEEIFNNINKTKRYEINRAKKRDGVCVEFLSNCSKEVRDSYYSFYKMYEPLGLFLDKNKVWSMMDNNQFVIGRAIKNGEILVQQGYVLDYEKSIVMLFSNYNNKKSNDNMRQLIGRANELLLYKGIIYFKELGFKAFDCGGMPLTSNNNKLRSIAEYKKKFGFVQEYRKAGFVFLAKQYRSVNKKLSQLSKLKIENIIVWGSEGNFGKYIVKDLLKMASVNIVAIDKKKHNEDIIKEYKTADSILLVCTNPDGDKNELMEQVRFYEFNNCQRLIWMREEN